MHWLDLTLLIVLGLGAFWGALNGLIRQVARVGIFLVAVYLCIYFHEPVAQSLERNVRGISGVASGIASYAVIFFGVVLVGWMITWKIENLVTKAKLQPVNRLLGAGFGVVKMGMFAGVALMVLLSVAGDEPPKAVRDSKVAPVVLKGMRGVLVAVPDRYKDRWSKSLDRWKSSAEEKIQNRVEDKAKQEINKKVVDPNDPYTAPLDIPSGAKKP